MAIINFNLAAGGKTCEFRMDDMGGLDYVVHLAQQSGLAAYEPPYPAFMAAMTGKLPGCYLDAGANTGLFSLMAAALAPEKTIHAFEPLRAISDVFLHNLALNPNLAARIILHRVALSDATGEAVFHETVNPHGLYSTSSSLDEAFSRQHGKTRQLRVPAMTLDDWTGRHGVTSISFVKVDVEGHETAVIRGAIGTVKSLRPVIGVELLGAADFDYLTGFLAAHDYLDCVLRPDAISFGRKPEFVSDGWNHVLVPRERLELARQCAREAGLRAG